MAFIKNEYVKVKGIFSWAKLVVPEEFEENGKIERYWSITIHPDSDGLEVVRDLQARGIMNKMKKDDDGYYIKFKRPVVKTKRNTGETIPFEKPGCFILGMDGKPVPMDGVKVGNGTTGEIKLECYGGDKPRRYFAARLDSVLVSNLVEYDYNKELKDSDRKAAETLTDGTEPVW